MFLKVGTLNAAHAGVCIHERLEAFLQVCHLDVIVLPEADIPACSAVRFCHSCRAFGWHACVSKPLHGKCRVAILSLMPFKQVQLGVEEATGRCAAVLIDCVNSAGTSEPILFVGLYLEVGNEPVAAGQAEDVLQQAVRTGFRFVAIGDWNLLPEHPVLLEYCSSGLVSCADECRPGEQLPATGPVYQGSCRRRIDFAVQHCQFPALQVWHHEGPSDHLVVAYEYDATQPLLRRRPRRRK